MGYVQFSPKQTIQEVSLFKKQLQQVHKPLQVTMSTQTYPDYTLNLSLRSRTLKIERNTLKRENNESSQGFIHNGKELHHGFAQPKNLNALNSRLSIDTQ